VYGIRTVRSEVSTTALIRLVTVLLTSNENRLVASVLGKPATELKLKVSCATDPITSLCGDGIFELIEPALVGTH
jgi:hypothetical protein